MLHNERISQNGAAGFSKAFVSFRSVDDYPCVTRGFFFDFVDLGTILIPAMCLTEFVSEVYTESIAMKGSAGERKIGISMGCRQSPVA